MSEKAVASRKAAAKRRTSKLCLPHLLKSDNPHVLNLSPPLDLDPRWFKLGGVAYTMAKYNMSMCALGMAEEFRGKVAFNCLWCASAAPHLGPP